MAVIETLVEVAAADTDLLRKLDAQGDRFSVPRDVEFLLRAPSADKATIAAGFINCWRRPKTEPLLKVVPIEN